MKQEQKNTSDEYLDKIHKEVKKLDSLLEDRQPGLITWCTMFHECFKNITILYYKNLVEERINEINKKKVIGV